jgi:hypothetical protein
VALRIHVLVPIRPTEDPEKVRGAIVSLFPGAAIEMHADRATAIAPSFARIAELVRSYRIPDTARGQMLAGLTQDGLRASFLLGKQAAAVGRAHFGPLRSPLGDIEVTILGDVQFEVERLIYETAPDTTCTPEQAQVPPALRPIP